MNDQFQLWKKQALSKLDKSHIGSIDEKIQKLCDIINNRGNMFTLSSCSGRICLIEKNTKKQENIWKYISHDKAKYENILSILVGYGGLDLEFRQESAILHICVNSEELARKLMHIGKLCGFNQVGIIANKTKIVVELICEISINCPVFDKKVLVNDSYLKYIISKSNSNLELNWKNIKKLEDEIKKL